MAQVNMANESPHRMEKLSAPQNCSCALPKNPYKLRAERSAVDVSGACFTGSADELSKSYATFLAEQLSVHRKFFTTQDSDRLHAKRRANTQQAAKPVRLTQS
jgi:hypothetical protein